MQQDATIIIVVNTNGDIISQRPIGLIYLIAEQLNDTSNVNS